MDVLFQTVDVTELSSSVTSLGLGVVVAMLIGVAFYYVVKYLPGKK